MMSNGRTLLFLTFAIAALVGCSNVLKQASAAKTDDALLFDAEMKANTKDYSGAINDIQAMTSGGQSRRSARVALASYYGGRCGLDLLSLAQKLKDQFPSVKLWPLNLSYMVHSTASQTADCKLGEQTALSISTDPSLRNANENVLTAFIEFSKMGSVLASSNADANHDGAVDGSFNPCSTSDISDTSVAELGTGLTISARALAASGFAANGLSDTVANLCSQMETYQPGFCDITDPTTFSAQALLGLRALMKSNEIGFNTCGGTVGSAGCTCP